MTRNMIRLYLPAGVSVVSDPASPPNPSVPGAVDPAAAAAVPASVPSRPPPF